MTRSGQTYYFYQDGRGNTSQLSDPAGNLLESYKYDLNGTPSFYDGVGNPRTSSLYNNRFLFTGRQYFQELGLYNYRNRFYSPTLNRFLQADPIGFGGDPTNLYRYCGNNPANRSDPMGTDVGFISNGFHNWVGVTNPTGSMTYFDFSPAHPNIFFVLTLGFAWPGEWNTQDNRPEGVQYETIPTTSGEDANVLQALNDRVQNQGDWYSSLLNDCYTAPMDLVDEVLSSNTGDYPSQDGLSVDFISLITASPVATPSGASDLWDQYGRYYGGSAGYTVLPGGQIGAPGGGTVAGYTDNRVGPLSPVNYNWFFSTLGWLGKPMPYNQYVSSFPRGYSGSDIGGQGGLLPVKGR